MGGLLTGLQGASAALGLRRIWWLGSVRNGHGTGRWEGTGCHHSASTHLKTQTSPTLTSHSLPRGTISPQPGQTETFDGISLKIRRTRQMLVSLRVLQAAPETSTLLQATKSPWAKVTAKIHPLERQELEEGRDQAPALSPSLSSAFCGAVSDTTAKLRVLTPVELAGNTVRNSYLLLQCTFLAGKQILSSGWIFFPALLTEQCLETLSATFAPKLREPNQLRALAPFMVWLSHMSASADQEKDAITPRYAVLD